MGTMGSESAVWKKRAFSKAVAEVGSTLHKIIGCHELDCRERE